MLRNKSIPAKLVQVGVAVAVATAGSITLFQGVSSAATATYKAVPATGPAGNPAYVITLTGTGFTDAGGTSQVHGTTGVKFAAACGATYVATTGTPATAYSVASATKLVTTTPNLSITGSSTAYKVCVFDLAANLLGSTTYTVYSAPIVTSAATSALSPSSGPAFGGNTVTVVGTSFTSKLTATVAGVPLTGIKVTGTTSFTAKMPAHTASVTAVDLVATTEGGPSATNAKAKYTYLDAISISPQVGALAGGTVLDITGVGFSSLAFDTNNAANSAVKAYIYFVPGVYNNLLSGGVKTLGQTGTCGNVQVVSDTELTCVTPAITQAAYSVTLVNDGSIGGTGTATAVSAASTFTYAPF